VLYNVNRVALAVGNFSSPKIDECAIILLPSFLSYGKGDGAESREKGTARLGDT
jgi:hypothetical protein